MTANRRRHFWPPGNVKVRISDFADHAGYRVQWVIRKPVSRPPRLVTAFKDFPAVEWFLRFENTGAKDSPILEKVQALDIALDTPRRKISCSTRSMGRRRPRSYVPWKRELPRGQSVALAPAGGRPSSVTFPFFNLQQGSRGFFTAIGWTGQWAASASRNEAGATHLQAGMELTHLSLHPGESIRTSAHPVAAVVGRPVGCAQSIPPPVAGALLCQSSAAGRCGSLLLRRPSIHGSAARGQFGPRSRPDCRRQSQPRPGLRHPLAGRRLVPRRLSQRRRQLVSQAQRISQRPRVLWAGPAKIWGCGSWSGSNPNVSATTRKSRANIRNSFCRPAKWPAHGGLFNLGYPPARRWMTDLLVRLITDSHIHTYRNDFNMAPLPFWRQNYRPTARA